MNAASTTDNGRRLPDWREFAIRSGVAVKAPAAVPTPNPRRLVLLTLAAVLIAAMTAWSL